ncbi:hypothetical protein [Gimesia aquarii]|uniref:IFT52 GIFT domain-containing protein n=1 Tax=Gimesia aquarii TaxID=2527964 RepID=A0A517WWR0_9PLAN|nr:hypothetical protein [Gimesia aquarii]QDU09705.1 hypothetical protein V202x_30960 [Gimesia aquarii]
MSTRYTILIALISFFNLPDAALFAQTNNRNILPSLDVKAASVSGTWTKKENDLIATGKGSRLILPGKLAGSYSITAEFTRTAGDNSIGVILPVGPGQCLFNLSAFNGEAHGIGLIDGKLARDNQTTIKPGTLKNNHPYRLLIEVDVKKNTASISSQLDGRPSLNWNGNPRSLSMFEAWKIPKTDQAGLYTNSEVTFHSILVNRLDPKMRMTAPTKSTSTKTTSTTSTGNVLYYDRAHGEGLANGLETMARNHNFAVKISDQPISSKSLKNVQLLYIRGPSQTFSTEEKAAIVEFIQSGGAFLLVMDEERRMPLQKTGVNEILKPFNMKLTADTEYLHNCGAIAKAGLINRADRELPFSGGRAIEGGTPFGFQLDKAGKPAQPFAAFQQVDGGGKIIVLAEGMSSMLMGTKEGVRLSGIPRNPAKTTYWGKDSQIFMTEVLAWLMKTKN